MDLERIFNKLKGLNRQLYTLSMMTVYPNQEVKYSLEYDLFMEFIGLYKDAKEKINNMPDNSLDKKRWQKKLEELWNENEKV